MTLLPIMSLPRGPGGLPGIGFGSMASSPLPLLFVEAAWICWLP